MLERLEDLMRKRRDFAFESTLSSRTLAVSLRTAKGQGFRVVILYFWLPAAEIAVARVRERVSLGGHSVPDEVVRRRYRRGLDNLFRLYIPLADAWRFYDNSNADGPRLVARGGTNVDEEVIDARTWRFARSSA